MRLNIQVLLLARSLPEAYRLHADIVMSLEDIFGLSPRKTAGRIWKKLGKGMGKE